MATPVFCCGFECGVTGAHWTLSAGATFTTSSPISGARSLSVSTTGGNAFADSVATFSGGVYVWRVRVKLSALPITNIVLLAGIKNAGAYFNPSDGKVYAGTDATQLGATGVAISTGQTYRIDIRVNSSANPWLVDVRVNGTTCGQRSTAVAADTTASAMRIGFAINTTTATALMDDVLLSLTSADFPLGPGKVEHFIATADGTHNVAGANDFERTLTGTDILNSTTDAFQLIDDVPLDSTTNDWINMIAPPNAGDYVECVFGPAPGISTPTAAPRAVEVIAGIHQAGTGTGNMEIRLNDNGTTDAVYSATGVAGSTSILYKRKHYASGPAGAWTIGGGGNGDFNNLKIRFGSPAALDVNPDQYFDSVMIEAEFVITESQTVTPGNATLTLTTFAPQLQQAITVPKADLSLSTFAPSIVQGKTVTPANASLALSTFAPQLQQNLTVPAASLSLTTFAPFARVNQILTVPATSLPFTTFAPVLNETVTPASQSLVLSTFAPQLQQVLTVPAQALNLTTFAPVVSVGQFVTPDPGSLSLTTFAPQLRQQLTPASASLVLTGFAPSTGLSVVPGAANISLTAFAPQLQTVMTPQPASLTFTTFAPSIASNITVTPQTATLTLTTFAPSANNPVIVRPDSRSLTLTPFAPILQTNVTAQAQALNMTTFAPVLQFTSTPAAALLALQTFAPMLQGVIVVPSRTMTLTRFAPDVFAQTDETKARTLSGNTYVKLLTQANTATLRYGGAAIVRVKNGH